MDPVSRGDAQTITRLVDALGAAVPLAERLEQFAEELRRSLGADGLALVGRCGGAPLVLARSGLEEDEALALEARGDGLPWDAVCGRLVSVPAEAAAAPPGAPLAALALRLAGDWLARDRERSRTCHTEEALAALSHEMNNSLTTLLCHSCEPVVREAQRLRALVEVLRHLRGRVTPRDARFVPDYLERLRKLLAHARGGTFPIVVRCAPEVTDRVVGPEQTHLLPALIDAGFSLRALAREGSALTIEASLERDRVQLTLAGELATPPSLAGELEVPTLPGVEVGVRLDPPRVALSFLLDARPTVIALRGEAPLPRLEESLSRAGLAVLTARDEEEALSVARAYPTAWQVLIAHDARAAGLRLRRRLYSQLPSLAMRCVHLDPQGQPELASPEAPDEVDIGSLLRRD